MEPDFIIAIKKEKCTKVFYKNKIILKHLGKDTADNQYKVIAVRIENNDGLLNNGHGSKLIKSTNVNKSHKENK